MDFFSYIKGFPLHKVECIHLSGYEIMENNRLQDSHLSDIDENIFAILREILPQTNAKYVLLERDFNVFNFNDISNEIAKIKEAVNTSVLL
ncbi:DUF692 domain-containing protein [Bacillus aquiflavi]|nr:DUF692 domain-containing protein [Bacillus aquiflavi]